METIFEPIKCLELPYMYECLQGSKGKSKFMKLYMGDH